VVVSVMMTTMVLVFVVVTAAGAIGGVLVAVFGHLLQRARLAQQRHLSIQNNACFDFAFATQLTRHCAIARICGAGTGGAGHGRLTGRWRAHGEESDEFECFGFVLTRESRRAIVAQLFVGGGFQQHVRGVARRQFRIETTCKRKIKKIKSFSIIFSLFLIFTKFLAWLGFDGRVEQEQQFRFGHSRK
jgi:hypothetical protein